MDCSHATFWGQIGIQQYTCDYCHSKSKKELVVWTLQELLELLWKVWGTKVGVTDVTLYRSVQVIMISDQSQIDKNELFVKSVYLLSLIR